MADEITIGTKAIKEVQDLRAELIKLSQDALNAGKTLSSISTPGMLNKSGSDNANASAQLDTFKTKYIALSETIQKGAEKSRLAEIRLQQQREKAFDSFERNSKKELDAIEKANNEYNKLQNTVNNMTKSYNDLNTRKQLGENLSAKEETHLKTLKGLITEYSGVLKSTDSQIGKYGRNVGNYGSQWNGLANSINQLTREAPAFAVSLNTGFLALSNNIPVLYDEINKLRQANIELAKSGQPVKSVFGQLAGALFTWGTALSLGVTLLTLYGGTLIDSITGSKKKKEALEAEKKAIEEKTKAEQDARDAIAQVQAIEVSRSQILLETAKNVTLSYKQRVAAVKELQERYPDYLGHLSKEQILAGDTAKAEEDLNQALINRGKALAAQKFLQTNLEKQLSTQIERTKLNEKKFKLDTQADVQNGKIVNGVQQLKVTTDLQKQAIIQKRDAEIKANNASVTGLNERLRLLRNEQDAFLMVYNENAKYLDVVHETTKAIKDQNREKINSVGTFGLSREQDTALERLKQLKQALEITRDQTAKNVEEFNAFEKSISDVNKAIDVLTKPITVDVKILGVPETGKEIKKLSNYMKSFIDDFSSSAGLKNVIDSFDTGNPDSLFSKIKEGTLFNSDNWKESTVDIMESVQEMYNFISNASQANFDAEKERLQSQYDVAFKYANGNKEAETKLAEDLEAKKKDIANREAKAKKQQAIYNIAIDTAQAVVAALPNFVLAGIVAAFGIAQAVIVSGQKVPQYWMGGTHEGGLMMVNDGAGANFKETIVTPDGQIHKPQGKNVLMNAPKGTQIFTHDQWNDTLTDMLRGNGINRYNPIHEQQNGMTKDDFYEVMSSTLGGQPIIRPTLDAKGFSTYTLRKGKSMTRSINRANGKA